MKNGPSSPRLPLSRRRGCSIRGSCHGPGLTNLSTASSRPSIQSAWAMRLLSTKRMARLSAMGACGPCRTICRYRATCILKSAGSSIRTISAGGWLAHGFRELAIAKIIAYATTANTASVNVMKRIGMSCDAARDFDHPRVAKGYPLRPRMVYSASRQRKASPE